MSEPCSVKSTGNSEMWCDCCKAHQQNLVLMERVVSKQDDEIERLRQQIYRLRGLASKIRAEAYE